MNKFIFFPLMVFLVLSENVFSKTFQSQLPASNIGKSKINFEKLVTFAHDRYAEIYAKEGLTLNIITDWGKKGEESYNAFANLIQKAASLTFYGTYYRNPKLTNDGYLSVICHEIGHHLGNLRMRSEGEADYYAAHICMPYLLSAEDNNLWLKKNSVPFEIRQKCDQVWGKKTARAAVCARATTAFFNRVLADEVSGNKIKPHHSNLPATISEILTHPDGQCRMETYLAGGLCVKEQNVINSKTKACSYQNFQEIIGMRPTCWKSYPRHPGTNFLYETDENKYLEKLFLDYEMKEEFPSEIKTYILENLNQSQASMAVAKELFERPGVREIKDLQEFFIIRHLENKSLEWYLEIIFLNKSAIETRAYSRIIMERGSNQIVSAMIIVAFKPEFIEKFSDLILNLIERNDVGIDTELVRHVFSTSSGIKMNEAMRTLINRENQYVLQTFAYSVFTKPYVVEIKDLLRLAIEKGSIEFYQYLAIYVFSTSVGAELSEFIKMMVETGNINVHRDLAKYTFSQPFAVKFKDLISTVMNNGDQETFELLINHTFSQPHVLEMKDLLQMLIQKCSGKTCIAIDNFVFSKSYQKQEIIDQLKEEKKLLNIKLGI